MKNILWTSGHTLLMDDAQKAEGNYVYDSKGKKYLDLESGVWVTCLGHSHPRINKVIAKQSKTIMHTGMSYLHKVVDDTALKILAITNLKNGKCGFLCSGSEAVEFGAKVMQLISGKKFLMTMKDSFLSMYGSTGNKKNDEWFLFDWLSKCKNCSDSQNCFECKDFKNIPFDTIGGFLFEPGSSSGLVRFPPEKIIQCIVDKIKEKNGFIMCNEITTGIGRTGKWFGYQHYSIQPNIVAMGKSLGNGYPVSAIAVDFNVAKLMEEKNFRFYISHMNNPLGAAVVKEVLSVLEEEHLIERCNKIGNFFIHELIKIGEKYSFVKEVRGRGLMIAVEFVSTNTDLLAPKIQQSLFNRGYLLTGHPRFDFIRLDPSYTIDEKDIFRFLKDYDEVLASIV